MIKIKKINSFFIEIIFVVLFFAFSSAIILGIFAEARRRSIESNNINIAIFNTQKTIETIKENGFTYALDFLNDENTAYEVYEETDKKTATIAYDSEWLPVSVTDDNCKFITEIIIEKSNDGILKIIITTKNNAAPDVIIFEIKTGVYNVNAK